MSLGFDNTLSPYKKLQILVLMKSPPLHQLSTKLFIEQWKRLFDIMLNMDVKDRIESNLLPLMIIGFDVLLVASLNINILDLLDAISVKKLV